MSVCIRCLLKGPHLLGLWLGEDADPLESPYCSVHNRNNMVLQVSVTRILVVVLLIFNFYSCNEYYNFYSCNEYFTLQVIG